MLLSQLKEITLSHSFFSKFLSFYKLGQVIILSINLKPNLMLSFPIFYFDDCRGFYTTGHSAGGHLAVMMASVDWTKYQLPANLIKGKVQWLCGGGGVLCMLKD